MKTKTDKTKKMVKVKARFEETKIKMMMDIYNVSRSKAAEMIAARAAELAAATCDREQRQDSEITAPMWRSGSRRFPDMDRIVSAEDFFGK